MTTRLTGAWEGWTITEHALTSPTGRTYKPSDIEPTTYTQADLARVLGVTRGAIADRIRRGTLPPLGLGKKWRYEEIKHIIGGGTNKMKVWPRETYQVVKVAFDHDLHEFEIWKDNEKVGTITPADLEDQARIISDLDAGKDVNGWEDGMGNTITI